MPKGAGFIEDCAQYNKQIFLHNLIL